MTITDQNLVTTIWRAIDRAVDMRDVHLYQAAWGVLYDRGRMSEHAVQWLTERGVPSEVLSEAERVGVKAYHRAIRGPVAEANRCP